MSQTNRYILLFLILAFQGFSQNTEKLLQGKVTFVTSTNAYVKFDDTEQIKIGDTLLLTRDSIRIKCLVVNNKSSSSSVCSIIGECKLTAGDIVIHPTLKQSSKKTASGTKKVGKPEMTRRVMSREELDSAMYIQKVYGRISAAGYSNLSETRGNSYRTMYQLSLNASHIKNSRFSFESDLNYRQIYLNKESKSTANTKYFNIYNLALKYDSPSELSISLGRKINQNATSLGPIDGLQVEKYFGNFYGGIIGGFKPDIFDQNFNADLLQYGAFLGHRATGKNVYSKSTLGILEQKNKGVTDRRYAYFQHSSTIGKKLNLFSSVELDFYNKVNDQISGKARLTNLYASAGYRFNKIINVNVSYDSRKRILYYETFRTEIERLLEDDEARQGARIRVDVKPIKNTNIGISYAKRFQSSGQNPSDNINGYFTLNKIPLINGLLSVNYNINTSNYLESKILSFRHSRYLFKNKLYLDFYYRIIQYEYKNNKFNDALNTRYNQKYIGANVNVQITKKISFSLLGEMSDLSSEKSYRINSRIIKRF